MAQTEELGLELQARLAADLHSHLTDPRGGAPFPSALTGSLLSIANEGTDTAQPSQVLLELGEGLPVWILGADGVARFASNQQLGLGAVADATNRWHHQLKSRGEAIAFSRTLVEADSHSITEIFYSKLPALIQRAIKTADETISDEKFTRLLFAPAYQIHALWFVNKDGSGSDDPAEREQEVLIAIAPEDCELQPGRFLSAADFLATLAAQAPVEGVILRQEN